MAVLKTNVFCPKRKTQSREQDGYFTIYTPIVLPGHSVSSLPLHSWRRQGMPVELLEGPEPPG